MEVVDVNASHPSHSTDRLNAISSYSWILAVLAVTENVHRGYLTIVALDNDFLFLPYAHSSSFSRRIIYWAIGLECHR